MTRNLKALGLALAAMLAMGAVAASSASADFMTETGKDVTLTVEAHPGAEENEQVFAAPGSGEVICQELTTHDEVVSPGKSITVSPTYTNCKAIVGESELAAKVTFTSCDYNFTTEGIVHVECTKHGDYIHIEVTAFNLNCFTIEDTQTFSGIKYTNKGTGATRDITLDANVTGIKYTEVGICGSGETTSNGTYNGKATIKGDDPDTGAHVGIWHEAGSWE
jgi:hypothetical protein